MTDRAASEVIGFVLVFSLILASVIIVTVSGLNTLQNIRDTEQIDNAERTYEILADNVEDMYRRGARSRATEISLQGAFVSFGDSVRMNVTADDQDHPSQPDDDVTESFTFRPIVYRDDATDTELVYSAGSVFRVNTDEEAGVVVGSAPMIVTKNRVLVPMLRTTKSATSSSSLGGSTVLVRMDRTNRNVVLANRTENPDEIDGDETLLPNPDGRQYEEINVTISDAPETRLDLWERQLEDRNHIANCDRGTGRVSCHVSIQTDGSGDPEGPERLYIVRVDIETSLKG